MKISRPDDDVRLEKLATAIDLLTVAAGDLEDSTETAAVYACADRLVRRLIAIRARTWRGACIKAEMVAWCCASRTDFGLGEAAGERMINSLLRDLLAPPPT